MTDWTELAPLVRAERERFLRSTDPRHADIRRLATEHNLLPVVFDWTAFAGLSESGELVWVFYDPPHEIEAIKDSQTRHLTLARAVTRYPSLQEAAPQRTATAQECPSCHGSGVVVVEGTLFRVCLVNAGGSVGFRNSFAQQRAAADALARAAEL